MPDFDASTYFLAPSIQQSFIDKDSGELLAFGKVYFFKDDNARNTRLDVFYLTGSYPYYTVTPFPYDDSGNEVIELSSIGTVVDPDGNPCEIYYHPYDEDGNIVNYYIEVYNEDGVFQFSIPNFPGLGTGSGTSTAAEDNYICNGQFLLHNNIINPTHGEGYISTDETAIAPGGHYFVKENGSGTQTVTFVQDVSSSAAAFPRYSALFTQASPGAGGTRRDYVFRFRDVNTFTDDGVNPTFYTFGIEARTLSGSLDIILFYRKYYGTGGSTAEVTPLATKSITAANNKYTVVVNFGNNTGKSISPNGDDSDYIEIGVRFPVDSSYNVYLTDIFLSKGSDLSDGYPYTTKQEDSWRALAGGFPFSDMDSNYIYDGWLIGLPVYIGRKGFTADTSVIGRIEPISYEITDFSNLPVAYANGDRVEYLGSSSIGIPYQRLGDKYWNNTLKQFIYGTGNDYVTVTLPNSSALENILLTNNLYGAADPVSQSASLFTFDIVHIADTVNTHVRVYSHPTDDTIFYLEHKLPAYLSNNFDTILNAANTSSGLASLPVIIRSSYSVNSGTPTGQFQYPRGLYELTANTGAALANPGGAGRYWSFTSSDGTLPTSAKTTYHVWYFITDETAPAGNAIRVKITASDTAEVVAKKTIAALQGGEVTLITCPAGSVITASYYIQFQGAGNTDFYIWFKKDNVGTDPNLDGTGIEVDVETADTNVEVAANILEKVNKKFYAYPDLRGAFIRGFDDGRGLDLDAATRYSLVPGLYGDKVGTWEIDQIMKHNHGLNDIGNATTGGGQERSGFGSGNQNEPGGGAESRPYNISVQYVVRL